VYWVIFFYIVITLIVYKRNEPKAVGVEEQVVVELIWLSEIFFYILLVLLLYKRNESKAGGSGGGGGTGGY
tara:strand:- start:140 stop:352 length:213 start_codon:yes stop_codon:yes gene_type:complete